MHKSYLDRKLDTILNEEATALGEDPYQSAMNVTTELEAARHKVAELERQLVFAVDRLCGGLAIGIRKHQPGLNVGLGNGACKVGYKSKNLVFKPDIAGGRWGIDSPDGRFARRFQKLFGPHTSLTSDLSPLSQAVARFFMQHYRTLNEEIKGTGIILLNGKGVSLQTLIEHTMDQDETLRLIG